MNDDRDQYIKEEEDSECAYNQGRNGCDRDKLCAIDI